MEELNLFAEKPQADKPKPTPPPETPVGELFSGFLGQARVKHLLERVMEGTRLAHAYIFVGPTGTGRFAAAIEVARALNCQQPRSVSMRTECRCLSCEKMRRLQHGNLTLVHPLPRHTGKKEDDEKQMEVAKRFIQARSADPYAPIPQEDLKSGQIHIDRIRSIRSSIAHMGDKTGARVVVVVPAEAMNANAANSLLKLLEEPPENCLLILIASSLRDLFPTIVSRCQIIQFQELDTDLIATALAERRQLSPTDAALIARLSGGNLTRALELAGGDTSHRLDEALEFLRAAAQGSGPAILKIAEDWRKLSRPELIDRLNDVAIWLQDALNWKLFAEGNGASDPSRLKNGDAVSRMASRYEIDALSAAWTEIEECKLVLEHNVSAHLALAALGVKLKGIFH